MRTPRSPLVTAFGAAESLAAALGDKAIKATLDDMNTPNSADRQRQAAEGKAEIAERAQGDKETAPNEFGALILGGFCYEPLRRLS